MISLEKAARPPTTEEQPVIDEYYGIRVIDDYRWLEDQADPAVRQWTRIQNAHSREILDQFPSREAIHARIAQLYHETSTDYLGLRYQSGFLFGLKWQPPKQQRFLVLQRSPTDTSTESIVIDPNQLDPAGTTAIDWYVPSPDGKLVAVSLSRSGSEDGVLHVYESATGKELADQIPRVQYPTGGGSAAWSHDQSTIFYTRYPHTGERSDEDLNFFQQVYSHRLGESTAQDRYSIGRAFPRIAETKLSTTNDGNWLLATVANGDGGEFYHHLRNPEGSWAQISEFKDQATRAVLGKDEHLYILSRNGAPRGKILKLSLSSPILSSAQTIIHEQAQSIESFEVTESRIYTVQVDGGPSQIRAFDLEGQEQSGPRVEPVSSVEQIAGLAGDNTLFRSQSFTNPPAWYKYDPQSESTQKTPMFVTSPADFTDCEVRRVFALSKGGTKVPLNIILKKGTIPNGQNPALLTGYGGYGLSVLPNFRIRRRIFIDQGGVIAVANLRGGGEYGEDWHSAGKLTNKQNVFDDFIACANYLIDNKYTNPMKLAIEGGSNGGLLMGAVSTQRPDLFRAVVSHVGVYDMLRVELDPNGEFNTTEFGSVKDKQQFEAMYAYSPYHHVVEGSKYPAFLMLTGDNDHRVNPSHSRKMTARLQKASKSGRLVLLRTSSSSGHGVDTALDETIAQDTDVFAFVLNELGIGYRQDT